MVKSPLCLLPAIFRVRRDVRVVDGSRTLAGVSRYVVLLSRASLISTPRLDPIVLRSLAVRCSRVGRAFLDCFCKRQAAGCRRLRDLLVTILPFGALSLWPARIGARLRLFVHSFRAGFLIRTLSIALLCGLSMCSVRGVSRVLLDSRGIRCRLRGRLRGRLIIRARFALLLHAVGLLRLALALLARVRIGGRRRFACRLCSCFTGVNISRVLSLGSAPGGPVRAVIDELVQHGPSIGSRPLRRHLPAQVHRQRGEWRCHGGGADILLSRGGGPGSSCVRGFRGSHEEGRVRRRAAASAAVPAIVHLGLEVRVQRRGRRGCCF